jgi:hypothetical protein
MSFEFLLLTQNSQLKIHNYFNCQPSCRRAASIENGQQPVSPAGGMRSWFDEF